MVLSKWSLNEARLKQCLSEENVVWKEKTVELK